MQHQNVRLVNANQSLTLGKKLAKGGEGEIYQVDSDPSRLVKLYHNPNKVPVDKLKAMIASPPQDSMAAQGHTSICWPLDLVEFQGQIRGYIMPIAASAVTKCQVYQTICNVKQRVMKFPDFTFQDLLVATSNIALAVNAIHEVGHVIGDVNQLNFLITDEALISVVDNDSFQITDQNRKVHRCNVGTVDFVPPEIQGIKFDQIDRSAEHDRFGLAVLIYLTLMGGSHPFDSEFIGQGESPQITVRIKNGYFVHSGKHSQFRPGKHVLSFDILPPEIKQLFLDCFDRGHYDSKERPDAMTWYNALHKASDDSNLTVCTVNSQHIYSNHLNTCPWCDRFNKYRIDYFPSLHAISSGQHKRSTQSPTQKKRQKAKQPSAGTQSFTTKLSSNRTLVGGVFIAIVMCFVIYGVVGWVTSKFPSNDNQPKQERRIF